MYKLLNDMIKSANHNISSILYVEDDMSFLETLSFYLESHFPSVHKAGTLEDAQKTIANHKFDIVILDKWIGNRSSLSLIPTILSRSKETIIVLLTGDGDFSRSIQTLDLGADEYIVKPLLPRLEPETQETKIFFEEVYLRLLRAKETKALKKRNEILYRQIESSPPDQLIGRSAFVESVRSHILNCKNLPGPVLITGELGTGKSLIARLIHKICGELLPFITLDCSGVHSDQIESLLYGYPKGGVNLYDSNQGLLHHAHGGYLLIKGIDDLPLYAQEKFAQVLRTGQFSRVGECEQYQSQFRLIATSRKNLNTLSEKGQFNADLFQMIKSNHICLEPLRGRPEDIIDLATHYLIRKYGVKYEFTHESKSYLKSLQFSGNIKELRLLIDTAVLKAQYEYKFELIPEYFDLDSSSIKSKLIPTKKKDVTSAHYFDAINWVEKNYLESCLDLFENSKVEVQEALKLSRGTLYNKLKFHKITK